MLCPDNKKLVEFTMEEVKGKEFVEIFLHVDGCKNCLRKLIFLEKKWKDCPETEILCAFARKEIEDVDLQNSLKEHIESCAACKELYEKAIVTWKILLEEEPI